MTEARLWFTLARHTALLWRTGMLRFRLETFGVYYPAPPYHVAAWRLSPKQMILLLRRAHSYALWLRELEEVGRCGGRGWWRTHYGAWEELAYD